MKKLFFAFIFLLFTFNAHAESGLEKINHIIVISLENHSFDNLFGNFPGADGIANIKEPQRDLSGRTYDVLPVAKNSGLPENLPNKPFPIESYIAANKKTIDLVHSFYHEQEQINGGRMDQFAAVSDAAGLTMGYYDGSKTALWKLAEEYTLADHFFHAAFGGSFINHFWLICACTPRYENPQPAFVSQLDASGKLIKERQLTPDGYAVNTLMPTSIPNIEKKPKLPPQEMETIGDLLSEKEITWAWYSGGWNNARARKPAKTFQFHHQPFVYFKNYMEGTEANKQHLKDETDLLADLRAGTLPSVVFYKPLGEFNLHPGYADVASGDVHIAKIVKAIQRSSVWKDSVVIITFDENGGYWDHVPPPKIDRWGPGTRIPTIIISPFAKKHFVDHTVYDTTSILKLIETRYDLKPLGPRDAAANNLSNALELR